MKRRLLSENDCTGFSVLTNPHKELVYVDIQRNTRGNTL